MITLKDIRREVAASYGITPPEIALADKNPTGIAKRSYAASEARHVAVFLARRLTRLSHRGIADRVGYSDYSSSVVADRRITVRLQADDALRQRVAQIVARLTLAEVAKPLGPPNPALPAILASLQSPANEAQPQ